MALIEELRLGPDRAWHMIHSTSANYFHRTCVASILRLSMLARASEGILYTRWAGMSIGDWSAIEGNVGIICCCLPTLRPLATRLWRKIQTSKYFQHSRKLLSSGLSGLSILLGSVKLSSLSSSSKAMAASTATPSTKSAPGTGIMWETSVATKSEGSNGATCSKANTDIVCSSNNPSTHRSDNHGAYGCECGVAVKDKDNCFATLPVATTPNMSRTNGMEHQSPSRCRCDRGSEHNDIHDSTRKKNNKGQTSWLSMNETVYDDHDDTDDDLGFSRGVAYSADFPASAV